MFVRSRARKGPAMSWRRAAVGAGLAAVIAALLYWGTRQDPATQALSGLVTSEEVVLGPLVAGRLVRLDAREGEAVKRGQLLAELEPAELEAERSYYQESADALSSQVDEGVAALKLQEGETAARIRQASASVAAAEGDRAAGAAQLEEARATLSRQERLAEAGAVTEQERDRARRTFEAAQARRDSLDHQIEAQRAALELARTGAAQAQVRRATLAASRQKRGAAEAQTLMAGLRLSYTRLTAPIDGVVDVRAARVGEFINVGQPVLTLIDPDNLWVRADVEESDLGRIQLGDRLRVTLASGEEREGVVYYRGVDAAFATQRDVSRTKRDLRTFEIRLRLDNRDRRLALGQAASVLLPIASGPR
jgi:HlyD family secretion protein